MIRESSGLGEVEFLGCLETEIPISGVEAENLCGSGTKPPKAGNKAAGKILVKFDRIT